MQRGFICPADKQNRNVGYCISTCRRRCLSIPLLKALAGRPHEPIKNRYSVTEILNPPQMVYLYRNYDFYCTPLSLIWAIFGSAVHNVLEPYAEDAEDAVISLGDRFYVEKKFEKTIGEVTLVGKVDLYDREENILWDYKTMKSYAIKKLKAGDFENKDTYQTNIYVNAFLPETKKIFLECLCKDWSNRVKKYDKVAPVEDIEIPILRKEAIKALTYNLLQAHLTVQNNPQKGIPLCGDNDVWMQYNPKSDDYGQPLRCRDYCNVSSICPQYREFINGQKDIYPSGREFVQQVLREGK